MPIHYVLRENKMTPEPNDYRAVTVPTMSVDWEGLIRIILQRGSTTGEADLRAAYADIRAAILFVLLEGGFVNLDLASFEPGFGKKVIGLTGTVDPAINPPVVRISTGPWLLDQFRQQATAVKEVAALPEPILLQFADLTTGEVNDTATTGGIGRIDGENLKFDESKTDEGISFVPSSGSPIKVAIVAQNFPKSLTFQIPTLTDQAAYTLQVINRQSVNGPLRTGSLGTTLTGGVAPTGPVNP